MKIPFNLIILYIIIGTLPGIIWASYYLSEDSKNPEPKGKIIQIFLLGMLITVPTVAAEISASCALGYSCAFYGDRVLYSNKLLANPFLEKFIFIFLVIACIEEIFKFTIIKSEVLKTKEFDEPVDAMVYSIVASLGFASAENILYVFKYANPARTSIERFFTAVLIHALTGAIIGYFIGLVKIWEMKQNQFLPGVRSSKKTLKNISLGIILAILLHGSYNFLISFDNNLMMLALALIIIIALLVSLGFEKLKTTCYLH
ncbi:MAG: PrsW family intramembrane metalloprotease [bacterium]